MEPWIRNAIARIDVLQNGQSISRGTGTLIGPGRVLTALHVVANRQTDPPEPYPGEIVLTFPGGTTSAVSSGLQDRKADWALLDCATPPATRPVQLDSAGDEDVSWETFGFPDANPRDGMVHTGTIEAIHAELEGVPVHQLYSKQAAAGDGAPVKGLSGAPVLVGDRLVGVLRFALMRDSKTVAGTLYACPAASISSRRTAAVKLHQRGRWSWWPIAALTVPLLAGAVLSYLRVGSADVSLNLVAGQVGMVLSEAQPLLSSPPRLDTLRGFDLREALVPTALAPGGLIAEPRLDLFAIAEGGHPGSMALDVVPFPAGTALTLAHSAVPSEYALTFYSALPDLTLSVDGSIGLRVPGVLDTAGKVNLERVTLRPDSSHSELYLTPPPTDTVVFAPLRVHSLDFARLDKIRDGEQSHDQFVSTIHAGTVRFPGFGGDDTLTDAAPLAFRGSEGTLVVTGQAGEGVRLTFEGTVQGIRNGPRGMPTRLQSLIAHHLAPVIALLGAYLILTATIILRQRRRSARRALIGLAIALSAGSTPASAQVIAVPVEARQLIVRLFTPAEIYDENGAGIVVGETCEDIVIATAAHVVRPSQMPGDSTLLTFAFAAKSSRAARLVHWDDELDLAVLLFSKDSIPRAQSAIPRAPKSKPCEPDSTSGYLPELFAWDRQGNARALRNGDPLVPLGCPEGGCWQGQSPDPLIGVRGRYVIFESLLISPGSSGGGLFNDDWELVGLVLQKKDIQGTALTIDEVIAQVKAWGLPVALHRSPIPRAGYGLTLGVSILGAVGGEESPFPDRRFPSGRLVISRQTRSAFTYHLSGLRLAPDQLNINALMGGLSLTLRSGRFSLLPFAELGLGRVEGRYDAGGYYVANPSAPGGNRYVPFWRQSKQDGIGFGAGVTLQAVLLPHIILEGTIGHWDFSLPDSVPRLSTFFAGAGLRFGL